MKHMRGRSVLRRSAGPGISFQLCRNSHFLDTSKWNFVNLFPQSVLFLLPVVFFWAVLADLAPEAAVSLMLSSGSRAALLSCAF